MPLILNRSLYFINDFKYYLVAFAAFLILSFLILLFKRNKFILLLLAICYSLLASFAFGETYFRYIYDQSDGLGFLKVNQKWHQRHVVFNNYFRRDRQFDTDKLPGEFRIAVMGDSISFGAGIEKVGDRFSDLLQTRLRADGFNVAVYNLGVSGTDTEIQIKDFTNFKQLKFDLLIWQYFLNDINPATGGEGTQIITINRDKFLPRPPLSWLIDRSYFADWLYWRLSTKYSRTFTDLLAADLKAYQDSVIVSRHREAISHFLAQARKENLPVVVIMFPFLYQTPLTQAADAVYDQMFKFFTAAQKTVAVIDLKSIFRLYPASELMAGRFDSHPNELAHALAAQALYEKILAYISNL
ncbi:MAG: hypothetical protein A2784_04595 [Candidatus Chisholmbacteria bacterium RIFCSPHIGHO2_01_FULL_48_12]|uniref:SGNH hydrolase-type esterase domain-containing protein n=1 Tax=Candidatus Chisholmbacteria bacterium RIFCSPHIGHO2_01_FULL_48_12 TaxID=1797589 RepID=A0A1G1VMW0_9BACT|nr:MAG: hypothetical protein A2784_04595 [Candidatus Chisholmbacteria bacterium RIFCSPHIGHO2_01_FULL_48_12]